MWRFRVNDVTPPNHRVEEIPHCTGSNSPSGLLLKPPNSRAARKQLSVTKQKTHPNQHPIRAPESGPPRVRAAPGGDLACGNLYTAHFDKIRMIIKSIQTNAKTPSDTVVPQLRQEKKVSNHKNQRNEDPTGGWRLVEVIRARPPCGLVVTRYGSRY